MPTVDSGATADDASTEPRSSAPKRSGQRSAWVRASQWIVLAAPLLIVAVMGWVKRNVYDDGFIYLHVVQQILAGNGPVFNAGERVEVYTGVLWVGILTVLGALTPFALEWVAVTTGYVMTLTGMMLAMTASARLMRRAERGGFLVPVGALVFATTAVVWTYTTSGLETGLTFLWLAGCLWIFVSWASSGAVPAWALVVLGLGILIRPELVTSSAIFVLIVLLGGWRTSSWPQRLGTVAAAVALPVLYEVFRIVYFGSLVANTAIAKEGTKPRADQGLAYLWDLLGTYWLVIPLVALVLGAALPWMLRVTGEDHADRWRWAFLALPLSGVVNAAYIVVMGGDYLHGRLLMPALFAVLAPMFVVPAARRYAVAMVTLPWAVLNLFALRSETTLGSPFLQIRFDGFVTPADWGWAASDINPGDEGVYVKPGVRLSEPIRIPVEPYPGISEPTLAASGIGLQAYVAGSGVRIVDMLGLAEPFTSRLELTQRGFTGHEKKLPTPWVLAMLTAPGSPTDSFDEIQQARQVMGEGMIPPVTGPELVEQVEWARAALKCPGISDLRESVTAPLTLTRMWDNVVNAPSRTFMRIPADPQKAYAQYCGPGTPQEVLALR